MREVSSLKKSTWDRYAPIYERAMHSDESAYESMYARISEVVRGKEVLELATGPGLLAKHVDFSTKRMVATAYSEGMIREAKKGEVPGNLTFEVADATDLPYEDASFDVVISRNLTWTLPDAMQAYREWHRVLRADGMLLNFDSDYGETTFFAAGDQACVHAGIGEAVIAECNAIKGELRISTHRRPLWDVELLSKLGFSVQCDADVAPLVHGDERLQYDDLPLFGIYAKKVRQAAQAES